ncbi:MAG: hypothetical protein AAFO95_12690 [Cyanobacteria bacterium J06600_6]
MNTKISINLERESLEYLDLVTTNRSAYINQLIQAEVKKSRDKELEQAYIDQENDPEFHSEKQLWECTSGDGLEDA